MMTNEAAQPENNAPTQQVAPNNELLRRQWVRTERALPPTRTHVFVITDYLPEGMGILWRHGSGFIHMASPNGSFECIRRGGVNWVRRNIHQWMAP